MTGRLQELQDIAATVVSAVDGNAEEAVAEIPLMIRNEPLTLRLNFICASCRKLDLMCDENFLDEKVRKELLVSIAQLLLESGNAGKEIEAALEEKTSDDSLVGDPPPPRDRIRTSISWVFRRRLQREIKEFDATLQALVDSIRDQLKTTTKASDPLGTHVNETYTQMGFGILRSPFTFVGHADVDELGEHIENLMLKQAQHFTEEMESMLSMQVQNVWKQRYCTLTADIRRKGEQRYCFRFFEHKRHSKDHRQQLGSVILGLASTVTALPDSFEKPWTFQLVENGSRLDAEKFIFHAGSQRTLDRWLEVLTAITNSSWQATIVTIPRRPDET